MSLTIPPIEFNFEHHQIRTIIKNGEMWFYAAEFAQLLP